MLVGMESEARRVIGLISAPAGASFLDRLEHTARQVRTGAGTPFQALESTEHADREAAVALIAQATESQLLQILVREALPDVDSWSPRAPLNAATALTLAPQRAEIAEALVRRFGSAWSQPLAVEQWWWTDGTRPAISRIGTAVGSCGAWATRPAPDFLTTSPVEVSLAAWLVAGWEMQRQALRVWRLRAPQGSRVLTIDSAEQWAELVTRHPEDATDLYGAQAGWELNAAHQNRSTLDALWQVQGQRAARRGWRRFMAPAWEQVAAEWDAIHLTWWGVATAEGTAVDLGEGEVTMLRHFGSERTSWVAPMLEIDGLVDALSMSTTAKELEADRRWLERVITPRQCRAPKGSET